jgi:universal stress protein E
MARKTTRESTAWDVNSLSRQAPLARVNGHRYRVEPPFDALPTFNSILVDVDATADVHCALERAVGIAQARGAQLRIVDVVPGADIRREADLDESAQRRRARLERLAETVTGVTVDWDLLAGRTGPALVAEVRRRGHDLLMRSRSRDIVAPKELRDVDVQLFRTCPCPVWAVGYGAAPARPQIVAAVRVSPEDRSEDRLNARILEVAAEIAQAERGSVTLLHAWTAVAERRMRGQATHEEFAIYLDTTRRLAEREVARLLASSDIGERPIHVELRRGEPEDVIPEYIVGHGVDILVVGTNARTGIRGLVLGNMAERLLRRLPCSVVAVKQG